MMDVTADLAWDYTGDESSPLLQRSVSPFRWDDSCRLTRPQTQYIIHSLTESVQILSAASRQPLANDSLPRAESRTGGGVSSGRGVYRAALAVCAKIWPYLAVIIVSLQCLAVIVESIWDAVEMSHRPTIASPLDQNTTSDRPYTTQESPSAKLHKPIVQGFISPLCCLLLLFIYIDLICKIRCGRLTFCSWISSFICSLVVFSGVYASFIRFSPGCFQHVLSSQSVFLLDSTSASQIYIISFLSALHYSISVFTLYQSMSWVAVSWFAITVLTIQMLIGYVHFVLLVSNLWHFIPPLPSPSPPTQLLPQDDLASLRRFPTEYDTDSILFYQHPAGVNNHNNQGSGTAGSISGGAVIPVATDVTDRSVSIENRRLRQVTEDDMLLSNSI